MNQCLIVNLLQLSIKHTSVIDNGTSSKSKSTTIRGLLIDLNGRSVRSLLMCALAFTGDKICR